MSNDYKEVVASIDKSLASINLVNNDREMEKPYNDPYTTEQQKFRDRSITVLLRSYVEAYKNKVKSNRVYKLVIFITCISIVVASSILFGVLIVSLINSSDTEVVQNMVSLVTVSITFLTLIIGILQTITKYVFPENDEVYVTKIVEIIQNNDLENKKENIRRGQQQIIGQTVPPIPLLHLRAPLLFFFSLYQINLRKRQKHRQKTAGSPVIY